MLSSHLNLDQVEAIAWTFGSLAILLTVGRYVIRWKVTNGLHWDDASHLAAIVFMIATIAIFTSMIPGNKSLLEGIQLSTDDLNSQLWKAVLLHVMFFLSMWSVKLSFLLFYRLLFVASRSFSIAWWIVLAYNAATFIAAILCSLLLCNGDLSNPESYRTCRGATSPHTVIEIYAISFTCIVTSDILTMALPLTVLHGLQMSRSRKIYVGTLVCLSWITIVLDALRIAMLIQDGGAVNVLWVLLEVTLVAIISALPPYYSLHSWTVSKRKASTYPSHEGSDTLVGTTDASSYREPGRKEKWDL